VPGVTIIFTVIITDTVWQTDSGKFLNI